jgi:hypothetical protein
MENNDVKKNNFLNVEKTNKKNIRRRSSIKRQNIGKIIKTASIKNINNKDEELITNIPKLKKTTEMKSTMKSVFPLSKQFTILIIIINFILPGIGTLISCLKIDDKKIRRTFYTLGLCSFITSPLIIGYLLSLISSYFFYKCYSSRLSIERYLYDINKFKKYYS